MVSKKLTNQINAFNQLIEKGFFDQMIKFKNFLDQDGLKIFEDIIERLKSEKGINNVEELEKSKDIFLESVSNKHLDLAQTTFAKFFEEAKRLRDM